MTDDPARLLIVEPSRLIAELIRGVCIEIGFTEVSIARTLSAAETYLETTRPDLVIVNCQIPPVDTGFAGRGLSFIKTLRDPRSSGCPMVPIIALGMTPTQRMVTAARDAGSNEFLAVPFTVKGLFDHVWSVVDNPRPFVLTPEYFGPDRRRNDRGPAGGVDRRRRKPSYVNNDAAASQRAQA